MSSADVVVVGAGLAGLRAATDALATGADVAVLEARRRVGGRVWSHRFPDGLWCERGAEFVDATHAGVLALAAELGVARVPVRAGADDDARLLDVGGRATPFSAYPSVRDDLGRWADACSAVASMVDPDDPTGSALALELDERPASDLLAALAPSPMARLVIGRELRTEFMVPPNELSQLHLAWVTARQQEAGEGREAFRLSGGADRLAAGLAAPLGERVRLGETVIAIDATRGVVRTEGGGEWTAGAVVLTAPLPALSRIDVVPSLPEELVAVGYGVGGKVSVHHRSRVWRDHGLDGSAVSDRAWGELWETTDGQPGQGGVLTALLSSHDGAAMAVLPDAGRRVAAEIDRLFPGAAAVQGEAVATDWTNDPWSLGAYAAFGPGQLTRAWPLLRQPHGRLVLAGEHTDGYAGFMEGALRSGARAAALVAGRGGGR